MTMTRTILMRGTGSARPEQSAEREVTIVAAGLAQGLEV